MIASVNNVFQLNHGNGTSVEKIFLMT